MAGVFKQDRRRTAVVAAGAVLALVAGGVAAAGPADARPVRAAAVGSDCPAAIPLSEVTRGQTGQGLTVTTGSTPQTFDVEVLGVAEDVIAPGKDVIMVRASDVPGQDVISTGGGIWAGMSGSPVYVGGRLLGAAAYGFTAAPSPICGLTPAADMVKLLSGGASTSARSAVHSDAAVTRAVKKVVTCAGVAAPAGSLRQLPVPLSVSGVGARSLPRLQQAMGRRGADVRAYAGGSAARVKASATPAARPVPGGNFAAVLSYGDVSLTGVGTTTAVCGNQALAFGHPLDQAGRTSLGANDADSIAIVKDTTSGSFKMANPTQSFGTVDQDRFAAIRANLTATPPAGTRVTANIATLDGRSGTSRTEVVAAGYTDLVTYYAAAYGYLTIADRVGAGQAVTSWTIRGTRAGGRALVVKRANRFADTFDASDAASTEVASVVSTLLTNEYEPVKLSSVTFTSTASANFKQLTVVGLAVSVNGGAYKAATSVVLHPGDEVRVRTTMRPYRSQDRVRSVSRFTVPANAKGKAGALSSVGGQSAAEGSDVDEECLFDPESCEQGDGSLTKTVRALLAVPRNDEVVTTMALEGDSGKPTVLTGKALRLATVVGSRSIRVRVR